MAVVVEQNLEGSQNTGLATVTVNHSAAVAGRLLLLVVASDDYRTTAGGGRPESSGYALVTGGSQETFLGHYLWWKVAAGGETSVQYTIGSAATSCWEFYEVSGLDPAPFDISNGQSTATSGNTYTTPAIVPTAGERWLFASIAGSLNAAMSGVSTWLNSFVELNDTVTTLGSGTRDLVSGAELSATADGVASFSTGATYATSPQSRSGIIAAFKAATGAVADAGGSYVPPAWSPVMAGPGLQFRQAPRSSDEVAGAAPAEVTLTPADAVWSAVAAATVEPQPVAVTLTPAGASFSGVGLNPVPQPVAVTSLAATGTWAAVAVAPTPQPVQVTLTAATGSWAAVAVSPQGSGTLGLTAAVATFSAVAVTPTPQAVALTLTPATGTRSAVALVVVAQVALTAAVAARTAVAVTPTPGATPVTLTAAAAAWTALPGALQTPGGLTIINASATWTAVAVAPTPQPVSVTLTAATGTRTAVAMALLTRVVQLTSAASNWAARSVTLTLGQVAVTLAPAGAVWSAGEAVPLEQGSPGVVTSRGRRAGMIGRGYSTSDVGATTSPVGEVTGRVL